MQKPKLPEELLHRVRKLRSNQTPQEKILWSRLRSGRLYGLKWRRQHPLGKYIIDFVCLEKKLVVEVDGGKHNNESQKAYDIARTEFIKSNGFKVLRFWNNEVDKQLDEVMLRIEEFC